MFRIIVMMIFWEGWLLDKQIILANLKMIQSFWFSMFSYKSYLPVVESMSTITFYSPRHVDTHLAISVLSLPSLFSQHTRCIILSFSLSLLVSGFPLHHTIAHSFLIIPLNTTSNLREKHLSTHRYHKEDTPFYTEKTDFSPLLPFKMTLTFFPFSCTFCAHALSERWI